MPDKEKEKTRRPVPWEIKDPGVPDVSSIISPVELGNLSPASPDLKKVE